MRHNAIASLLSLGSYLHSSGTTGDMAELGLNIYQVIQNELITREADRNSLGIGFRLAIIEVNVRNAEAVARNGRIWKLHHSVSPVKGLTPESRRAARAREERLLRMKGTDRHRDTKDPTKLVREEERWEVCEWMPRTLLEFKELQFSPARIRDLMEFYDVPAYRPDQRLIEINVEDELRDISMNLETCMEELAMSWGINWQRIEGLSLPQVPVPAPVPFGPPAQMPVYYAPPPSRPGSGYEMSGAL